VTGACARNIPDELLQFLFLAVRQRVHRIDDDRSGTRPRVVALLRENRVHDGDEEAQRFAGPGAGRHNEALALRREGDGLLLVLVERQRFAGRASGRRGPKNLGAEGLERARGNQLVDSRRPPVVGVDLDQRLRPVAVARIDRLDLPPDILGVDGREGSGEFLVLADDRVAQREYVHALGAHVPTPVACLSFAKTHLGCELVMSVRERR
jgi:hypothetical protein